ncbi:hypothetical protein H4R19_004944, partial [Coemansia spiralis]
MPRSEENSPSHSSLSDSQLERASRRRCVAAAAVTPVDAAGIRVLVVPVGRVRASKAAEWTNAIAHFSQLPLSSVLGHAGDTVLGGYAGGLGAEGSVRFAFASGASAEHEHLEGLQTYRQVLGVVGVMDCALSDDVGAAYDEFLQVISRHTTAVAYRCLAFDLRADQQDDVPGVTVVPDTGRLLFYLQTLLCDFAATMLGALGLMAQSIEDRTGLQSSGSSSPNASQLGSPREAPPPTFTADQALASSRPAPPRSPVLGGSPGSRGRFGGEMDRESLATHLRQDPGSPLAALSPPPLPPAVAAKDAKLVRNRGNSASNGRLKKLQGDLYLMGGRLTEALVAYSTAMDASAVFHDHLWQAVAMEGYCAALLLLCERRNERRLAHAFVVGLPRGAESRTGDAEPEGLAGLLGEIAELFAQVPALFEKCHALAPLLHAEACVRAALVLQAAREALLGDCDAEAALGPLLQQQSDLYPRPTAVAACATRDVVAQTCGAPLRAEISRCLQRGWSGGLATVADQLELLAGVGAIYGRIAYSRKAAFFLRQFLLTAVPVLLRAADRGLSARGSPAIRSSSASGEPSALSAPPDGAAAFAAATYLPGRGGSGDGGSHLRPLAVPHRTARAGGANMHQAIVACLDSLASSLARSSWLHLQADGLRGCLALAEALPSYPHAIAFALRLVHCLKQLADAAPEPQRRALVEEQHTVRGYILRTIGMRRHASAWKPLPDSLPASPQLADGPAGAYVGGRDAAVVGGALDSLLEGIQLCTVIDSSQPIQTDAPASTAPPSLFLYTPGAQTQNDQPLLLAAGEKARFVATLRNPLPFALPLADVALVAAVDSAAG